MKPTTVLLVDDHTIVRQGIRLLLHNVEDIQVVGEAETGLQAVQMAKALSPNIVVMDLMMPVMDGLEATRQILRDAPAIKVLVLSSYPDDDYVRRSTEAGATGYLFKQAMSVDLVKAIRAAHQGKPFPGLIVPKRPQWPNRSALQPSRPAGKSRWELTSRQAQILRLIAEGGSNKRIASRMSISVKTVEKHRQAVMNKLNIHDTAGLTRYAITKGLVSVGTKAVRLPVPPLPGD